jgi:broad specificity phosphatase PhoE
VSEDPRAWLIRHGETAWSLSGQHTSRTDLTLTAHGRAAAHALAPRLAGIRFARVLTSPMRRARETCDLAGLGGQAQIEPDLMEWQYGEFEGLTPAEIHARAPGWLVFRDGCPGGESPSQIAERADRIVAIIHAAEGPVALFAHGHFFRVLAARWLGLPTLAGSHFRLDTATESVLGSYRGIPAIERWNVPVEEKRP